MDDCEYDTINNDYFMVEEFYELILEFFNIDFRRVFLKASSEYEKICEKPLNFVTILFLNQTSKLL